MKITMEKLGKWKEEEHKKKKQTEANTVGSI